MSNDHSQNSPLIVEAKNKANHLKSILKIRLPDISHGECLNIISRLERERDWNTYLAKLEKIGSSEGCHFEVDDFIEKIALPLISNTAAKYNLKVSVDPSKINNGECKQGSSVPRRISMRIESNDNRKGETYCEPNLDVTMTSLKLWSDWVDVQLNFVFPKEALPLAIQILSSRKISEDSEPRLVRFGANQEQVYMLTVNTSGISDTVDRGLSILTDPLMMKVVQKGFDRFFSSYGRAAETYSALHGKWDNKLLIADFENALWKLQSDDPPYMATPNQFYSVVIAGIQFFGSLGMTGPYILGPDGSVEIGVCSIVHLEEGEEGKAEGFYIAKYGDKWQTEIYLKGFNKRDVERLTTEFGIPVGRLPEVDTTFFNTPAFDALCDWTAVNPQFTKRVARDGDRYLPGWYDQVLSKSQTNLNQPTNQDFLNALEKEPYLIDFGIRCSFHVDRKLSAAENKELFHNQRKSFARSGYREFSVCCEWLRGCSKRKTINTSISSYRLKHMVEAWAKMVGLEDYYVSNGAFIAAAIHMGFDWKADFDSPNVRFNISKRSPAITALSGVSID